MSTHAMPASGASMTPVTPSERVELLDVLRGFALLGIIVVNFWGDQGESLQRLDALLNDALDLLVSGSFYPLFSFLFGIGFAVQLLRSRERGTGVARLYVRRMLALFLIGTTHAVLIWDGDILVSYALTGLLLLPLYRLRDRWLVPLALVILALGLVRPHVRAWSASLGGGARAAEIADLKEAARGQRIVATRALTERVEATGATSRAGALGTALDSRWRIYAWQVRERLSRHFFLSDVLAFFLLGLVIGRRRILENADRHRHHLRWTAASAAVIAVAGGVTVEVLEPRSPVLETLGYYASNFGTTTFYVAVLALAFVSWPRATRALRVFAAPGRIGLTNYLLQSLVMTLLFAAYGLGLSRPATATWLLLNLAFFFAVQVPLSRWWVARYRFGPAEWLWRSMTYGAVQPIRLEGRVAGTDDRPIVPPADAPGTMLPERPAGTGAKAM